MHLKKLILSAAIAIGGTSLVPAQVLLSVDFNLNGNANSVTETGFQTFGLPGTGTTPSAIASPSATFGNYTVALPGTAIASRYSANLADSGSFTYDDLLEDFAVQLTRTNITSTTDAKTTAATNTALTISGTGITANTSYQIRIWSLDTRNTGTGQGVINSWWDTSNGTGANAVQIGWIANSTAANLGSSLSDNEAYSVVGTVISDSNGVIRLGLVASGSTTGVLNGFQLSAIPEPATAAVIAGMFTLAVASYRRRRA